MVYILQLLFIFIQFIVPSDIKFTINSMYIEYAEIVSRLAPFAYHV